MKVEEIMIGDWISSPYGNIQVEFIYNNGYDDVVGEREEMYLDCYTGEEDSRMKDITIETVYPIPLTEEILLLNGFEYNEDFEEYLISIDKNVFSFEYDSVDDFYYFGSWIRFYHVHELQHLLRLCGLTELAVNFKIE